MVGVIVAGAVRDDHMRRKLAHHPRHAPAKLDRRLYLAIRHVPDVISFDAVCPGRGYRLALPPLRNTRVGYKMPALVAVAYRYESDARPPVGPLDRRTSGKGIRIVRMPADHHRSQILEIHLKNSSISSRLLPFVSGMNAETVMKYAMAKQTRTANRAENPALSAIGRNVA